MDQIAGEHSQAAVFAADGLTRQRLVRAAGAAGVALLAAWLIALVLGVLGGFGSLPVLPGSESSGSNAISTMARSDTVRKREAQASVRHPEPAGRTSSPAPESGGSTPAETPSSAPRITAPKVPNTPTTSGSPSTSGSSALTTRGKAIGTTQASGKPVGSPGNGPGGSGAPGQLR
jgi:hypothetical protein